MKWFLVKTFYRKLYRFVYEDYAELTLQVYRQKQTKRFCFIKKFSVKSFFGLKLHFRAIS